MACLLLVLQPHGGASLVAYKDKLFVIGGFCGHELRDVHIFDLSKQTWQEVTGGKPMPARSVFACALLPRSSNSTSDTSHDWIVVFGGEVDPSDLGHAGAGDYVDEVFGLNPERTVLGWQRFDVQGAAPSPRAWLASTSLSSSMVLHGGSAPDNSRLTDMFFLTS